MNDVDSDEEKEFLKISKELGLERVGWSVTDLVPDVDGKVAFKSFRLSLAKGLGKRNEKRKNALCNR